MRLHAHSGEDMTIAKIAGNWDVVIMLLGYKNSCNIDKGNARSHNSIGSETTNGGPDSFCGESDERKERERCCCERENDEKELFFRFVLLFVWLFLLFLFFFFCSFGFEKER